MKKIVKLLTLGLLFVFTMNSCSDSEENEIEEQEQQEQVEEGQEEQEEQIHGEQETMPEGLLGFLEEPTSFKNLISVVDSLQVEVDFIVPESLDKTNSFSNGLYQVLEEHKQLIDSYKSYMIVPENANVYSILSTIDNTEIEIYTWIGVANEKIKFTIKESLFTYTFEYAIVDENFAIVKKLFDGDLYKDTSIIEPRYKLYKDNIESSKMTWRRNRDETKVMLIFTSEDMIGDRVVITTEEGVGDINYYRVNNSIREQYTWKENGKTGDYKDNDDYFNNGSW